MRNYYWLLLLVWLCACNKEENIDYPIVLTGEVTDVDSTGATFRAKVTNLGKSQVTEWGFVCSEAASSVKGSTPIMVKGETLSEGFVHTRVSSLFVEGESYQVRSYIKTIHGTSFGNSVTFTSLGSKAPVITSCYPSEALLGDTISITGTNLMYYNKTTSVYFNEVKANVVYTSIDTIKAVVPLQLRNAQNEIKIAILENSYIALPDFKVLTPVIIDFYPKAVTWGTTVTIVGRNFRSKVSSARPILNSNEMFSHTVNATGDTITFVIPANFNSRSSTLGTELHNFKTFAQQPLMLLEVDLIDFSPKEVVAGTKVFLYGRYFLPSPYLNFVTIGGMPMQIDRLTPEGIEITIPPVMEASYSAREALITVQVNGVTKSYPTHISFKDPWIRLTFPNKVFLQTIEANNKVYFIDPMNNDLFVYGANGLQTKASCPGERGAIGFSIAGVLYSGLSYKNNDYSNDFWRYDEATDSWIQIATFPGRERYMPSAFALGEQGYIFGGSHYGLRMTDFWKYDPLTNEWIELESFTTPEEVELSQITSPTITIADNVAYIGLGSERGTNSMKVFIFNPVNAQRIRRINNYPDLAYGGSPGYFSFTFDNKPYFKSNNNHFYYYSTHTNTWIKFNTETSHDYARGVSFVLDNKIYIGSGFVSFLWQFDPEL
jgi:hypothetical protein